MKFSEAQLHELKACTSPEEAIAKAAEAGFELSTEQAEKLLSSDEFADINEGDLSAISGACNSSYHCYICNKDFDGSAPHAYEQYLVKNDIIYTACQACYDTHKDDYAWDY